ncbi:MAG: hypothetical protein WCF18_19715, partial [Chthoniobacteraceae bacterium]
MIRRSLVGDWNGDGKVGVALYAPKTSMFYLTNTLSTGVAEITFGYGEANLLVDNRWQPIVGDWNGDGKSGVGLYAPTTSLFYLTNQLAT